ncbi:uncharacterized protein LOC119985708 [Tripterygium wilfordii]|uniref:uncharacterized protein LOC119985708 n=1 Tax=Tripterygium wilfordii TaxID=458696 RepID=UPI0018F832BD|nr:uncharacterized protein LOC119985708 [Tripterygium wilfordii]
MFYVRLPFVLARSFLSSRVLPRRHTGMMDHDSLCPQLMFFVCLPFVLACSFFSSQVLPVSHTGTMDHPDLCSSHTAAQGPTQKLIRWLSFKWLKARLGLWGYYAKAPSNSPNNNMGLNSDNFETSKTQLHVNTHGPAQYLVKLWSTGYPHVQTGPIQVVYCRWLLRPENGWERCSSVR